MLYDTIVTREPIEKGWSGDKKYCVTTQGGEVYLLRIAPPQRAAHFRCCYEHMQQTAALQIPMCLPVELGECQEGVYALLSWVSGTNAEELIPKLPSQKQYSYGLDAGQILQKIHTIPAPAAAPTWEQRYNGKIDRKIAMYESCPLKLSNDTVIMQFVAENRHLLKDRPQTYQHGDYHIGNMMIDGNGILTVIDFDRDDYGDPWEEFNRIVWCAQESPAFASGMVDGYFNGKVPAAFWRLLALYICVNTLSSLPWAIPFGEGEIEVMRRQALQVLSWYQDMTQVVPSWYQMR